MASILVKYENQGLSHPPTSVPCGLWKTTFYAQDDITIRCEMVQLVPLKMMFDIKQLLGFIVAPMYMGNSLNIGSSIVVRNNQVHIALLEAPLGAKTAKYDEVVYIRKGEPLVAIHSLDEIVFEEVL
ncbi:hypothetical protein TSMG0127 [Halocynthia phage JM-2012]|uniref:hypothetical protein n=1 Tax=Halocynthia phage JM-2012 TaxID=1173297 RepID=UPI00025C695B|nr:hypothetical protein TSMG0127 [Halocynthia phage JM-2012]AFI55410.1 hypothetical protein TSMG0127 [Halocynthia phage JM-2012]